MGASTADIIARLTLNGTQFSSENARIFGEMETQARDTAGRTKAAFESGFSEIQKIASRALAMPRNAGGSLDLNVTGAREAAAAAEATAQAYREVATAAELAAAKTGDTTEATRIYVTAARAVAVEAEQAAHAALLEANALDVLQAELNQTRSATELVVEGNRVLEASQIRGGLSARGHGTAMMQAGQQAQDFFIQVGGGQSIMVAFIQQASQAAFVMQGMEGQAGKFAQFLTSGWGTAVIAGLTVLSLLISQLEKMGNEVDKAVDKLKEQAHQTDVNAEAQRRFALTAEGVSDAIRTMHDEMERAGKTQKQMEEDAYAQAKALINQQIQIRNTTKAWLEMAKAAALANKPAVYGAGGGASAYQAQQGLEDQIAELEKRLAKADQAIKDAEETARGKGVALADRRVADSMSAETRAASELTATLARLREERTKGQISTYEYEQRSKKAREDNEAELKRIRKAKEDARKEDRLEERTMVLGSPVSGRISSGFGHREQPRTTNGRLGSADHLGVDYAVGVGTRVTAGAPGVVVYTGEMGGYGKVVIVDYGKGTFGQFNHLSQYLAKPGDTVSGGQAIALSGATGNVTGPHLDYRVRTGARFDGSRLVGGQYVDPRSRVKIGDPGDAAANYEDARQKVLEEEVETRKKIIAASEQQLSVDAESLRFLGLKVRGLDEQSTVETAIAEKRREYAQQMTELSAKDRAEQSQRTAGIVTQLEAFEQQADAYSQLLVAAGDQKSLTLDQRKALDDANEAMLAQLEAARALATTAKDRLLIEEAIARVSARVSTARGQGEDKSRDDKRAADEAERVQKDIERDRTQREEDNIRSLASFYRNAFTSGGKSIVQDFKDEMLDMIAMVAAKWTLSMLSGQKTSLGTILGQMGATSGAGGGSFGSAGGILSALGLFQGGGSALAGASSMGSSLGALASGGSAAASGGLMAGISSAMPYLAIAAAAIPLVTSLFKSTKWGDATISLQDGQAVGAGVGGNSGSTRSSALGQANSVAEGVNRLAEQLGATISGLPGITVGSWDGRARVALTSTTKPLHSKNFGPDILKDFGDDTQAALEYAVSYAFSHAVLDGISQASKNIIAKGSDDVEAAIEKVTLIEDIPKRLQAHLDPVGYAVDQLNAQWKKAIDALEEGGASTEQMAEAQKLYAIELEQTKASAREASADLKDFLKSLDFGSSSPYSIRQQEEMARASLQPFLDKIAGGEEIDQGKFTDAAQAWLDIERQLYGSTGKFFDAMDMIQEATGQAISRIDNAVPIRTAADPFAEATAKNTSTTNELLAQISRQLAGGGSATGDYGSDFITEARLYSKIGG